MLVLFLLGICMCIMQIVLCENTIYSETCMSEVLTHELIHAYDFCRYNTNFSDVKHLACSEVSNYLLCAVYLFQEHSFID